MDYLNTSKQVNYIRKGDLRLYVTECSICIKGKHVYKGKHTGLLTVDTLMYISGLTFIIT